MDDLLLGALKNFYTAKGVQVEFEEKNLEKKAKLLAMKDQIEALARSLNDLEMATVVLASVGTECVVEYFKQEAKKSRGF